MLFFITSVVFFFWNTQILKRNKTALLSFCLFSLVISSGSLFISINPFKWLLSSFLFCFVFFVSCVFFLKTSSPVTRLAHSGFFFGSTLFQERHNKITNLQELKFELSTDSTFTNHCENRLGFLLTTERKIIKKHKLALFYNNYLTRQKNKKKNVSYRKV